MNCKPGDLAIVVRSQAGNEGRLVRCIRLLSTLEAIAVGYWGGPLWELDSPLRIVEFRNDGSCAVSYTNHCPDVQLRPIRDPGDDAIDEMVRLLGKPQEVTA